MQSGDSDESVTPVLSPVSAALSTSEDGSIDLGASKIPTSLFCCIISFLDSFSRECVIKPVSRDFAILAGSRLSCVGFDTGIDSDRLFLKNYLFALSPADLESWLILHSRLAFLNLDRDLLGEVEQLEEKTRLIAKVMSKRGLSFHYLSLGGAWAPETVAALSTCLKNCREFSLSRVVLPDSSFLQPRSLARPLKVMFSEITVIKSTPLPPVSWPALRELDLYIRPVAVSLGILTNPLPGLRRLRLRYLGAEENGETAARLIAGFPKLRIYETDLVPPSFWSCGVSGRLEKLTVTAAAAPADAPWEAPHLQSLRLRFSFKDQENARKAFQFIPVLPKLKRLSLAWSQPLSEISDLVRLRLRLPRGHSFRAHALGAEAQPGLPEHFLTEFAELLQCRCPGCKEGPAADHSAATAEAAWLKFLTEKDRLDYLQL